ncbi:MAG: hypothetical protein VKN83_04620 [Cyanobacteriota bacterium]|jgi:hypothetical protein|nr:hypothetical protein [Cyanobacteriota bacterium]
MPQLRRANQSLRDQVHEVHIFVLMGAIRIAMLWFSQAVDSLKDGPGATMVPFASYLGVVARTPAVVIYLLIVMLLYGQLLRGRKISAVALDGLGIWAVINLLVHFVKVNILMLSGAVEPRLLLGQVITYVLFFVLCWGWIFWRLDRIAGPEEQQIINVPSAANQVGTFNYYHDSLMSILDGRKMSLFIGVSRFGKVLVALHSLMILDLAAIALARFYQLVQKSVIS